MDIVGAATILAALLPLMLVIAGLVALDGGPVLFAHQRVGRGGRAFGCLKFRTMVPQAEARLDALLRGDPLLRAEWEETRKLRRDPRVTTIGRLLRVSSMDELPQLINVLRGQMSLVGPRPVVQRELDEHYGRFAADYLAVRPGITGPWQVSGRSDTSYSDRVALDVGYVRRLSLRRDVRILFQTVRAVLIGRGAC
ncbi:sugar transferase [Roseomonas sp. NAR14]|uniref:Sugar transferase n=1 Tax=Roseomonas acroporae TaxID=2937791 RepID=A0A9X1Y4J1_9PROT|nr:sugar transferase [Roseomonas acroporae]MCK8783273.1 sugar transferase [Roseomonas acroporae]